MTFERAHFLGAAAGDPAIEYSAREMRLPLDAVTYREGVCGVYDLQVVQHAGGPNQSVDVGPGVAIIQGDVGTGAGKYVVRNNATINFTDIPALPDSGSAQHILCVQVDDKQDAGAPDYDTKLILVQGPNTGVLPDLSTYKNILPIAIIERAHGSSDGQNVTNDWIYSQRQFAGSLATAAGSFDFFGGNGMHIDRRTTTRYQWSAGTDPVRLARPVVGCIVPDQSIGRVTNMLPGPWFLAAGMKINGSTVGPRQIYIAVTAPDGTVWRAGAPGLPDADGVPLSVSRPFIVPVPGCTAEAFVWQDVNTFTNLNNEGNFAYFTGIHGLTVPGVYH